MKVIRARLIAIGAGAAILTSIGGLTTPAAAATCYATVAHQLACYVQGVVNRATNDIRCETGFPPPQYPCP